MARSVLKFSLNLHVALVASCGYFVGIAPTLLLALFDFSVQVGDCMAIVEERADGVAGLIEEAASRLGDLRRRLLDRCDRAGRTPHAVGRLLARMAMRSRAIDRLTGDRTSGPWSWDAVELALDRLDRGASDADGLVELLAAMRSMSALALLFDLDDQSSRKGCLAALLAILDAIAALRRKLAAGLVALTSAPRELIGDLLSPHVLAAGSGPGLFVPRC